MLLVVLLVGLPLAMLVSAECASHANDADKANGLHKTSKCKFELNKGSESIFAKKQSNYCILATLAY